MCILAQSAFTVSVSIDNRLDKRVNIEHDDREQFSLIFQFLTLFKIFEKAQLLKKIGGTTLVYIYYLHHVTYVPFLTDTEQKETVLAWHLRPL